MHILKIPKRFETYFFAKLMLIYNVINVIV